MPIVHAFDPDDCGHSYRRSGQGVEIGLTTRHRADGTPRLLFDLTIIFSHCPLYDLGYSRRVRVDFEICRDGQLPPDVLILIGQDAWHDFQRRSVTLGSEPWRTLPPIGDSSFTWNHQIVPVYDWWVGLSWPVTRVASHARIPVRYAGSRGLAVPRGSACLFNPLWLTHARRGELLIDDEQRLSTFFPLSFPPQSPANSEVLHGFPPST